ncbi:Nitroreductase [Parelusimicrobium proximum]|uniref:nitroreductase family protein n=1 Tax=Parelusimicrobium proximum TaxID=3228953 RepID=UPI003D1839A0
MNTLEAIYKRRSIRKYQKGAEVTKEQLHTLLGAAMMAPSGKNNQSWEFVVLTEREALDKFMQAHPHAKMLETASACIIVCAKTDGATEGFFTLVDCAAAIQNILLAATELGLGSVWLGIHNAPERLEMIKELYSIPENVVPVGAVAVGVADEVKDPVDRYNESKVHYNKW